MVDGTGMTVFSDLYNIDGIVRHVGIVHGRNLLVDVLREAFKRDREYRFLTDIFGYPKTPSAVGLELDAGKVEDSTTRLFIGTVYRYENSYLPAINIRQTSISSKPIGFNDSSKPTVQYERQRTVDGYGVEDFLSVPSKLVYASAWNSAYEIKIISNSQEDTASIADICMLMLQASYRSVLERNGLFIKSVSAGGENAETRGANDPIFSVTISVDCYSEWRRELDVGDLVDRIHLCLSFDMVDTDIPANGLIFSAEIE